MKQEDHESQWQRKTGFICQRELPDPIIGNNNHKRKELLTQMESEKESSRQKNCRLNESTATNREGKQEEAQQPELQLPPLPQEEDTPPQEPSDTCNKNPNRSRYVRLRKPIQHLMEVMIAEAEEIPGDVQGEIYCLSVLYPNHNEQQTKDPLFAYKATTDPDTMYLHKAMKEPD